jgi:hypothetical protein
MVVGGRRRHSARRRLRCCLRAGPGGNVRDDAVMKFLRANWLWLLLPPVVIGFGTLVVIWLLRADQGESLFTYRL